MISICLHIVLALSGTKQAFTSPSHLERKIAASFQTKTHLRDHPYTKTNGAKQLTNRLTNMRDLPDYT